MRASIFGLSICPMTASQIARHILATPRRGDVGLVVTPNIQHVALLQGDEDFRQAYASAEIVTCDGFPVHYYARLRQCPSPGRVTGCDIVADLMADRRALAGHRPFFVVDHEDTASAVAAWAAAAGLDAATHVPPFGFEGDEAVSRALAETIAAHGTTILFVGLGAPKSEIFVHRHRAILPPCWALCVGQAVKMALGLTSPPPTAIKRLNLEWLWRILLEPRRMGVRYARSIVVFLMAVVRDINLRR
ncbi:WecB/TagA/CpsF family glycosyltransferase [Telmatospirillum sp.]|uniref:WecB/TagA/CpsF family glycosyltransferase n=1 Tax=Telmatospirillum sp. TaxID=2079197 RepID=UPI00285060AB|nr:WecB/TagA/CpsF family glycosyltransferase [Telmatospirillum sp.]MDR3439113.1 WecB/TagA/CpsF family glycosyltransferase [Telmatospirillum sp.]